MVEDVERAPAPDLDLDPIAGLLVGDEHVDGVPGRVPVERDLEAVVFARCQLFEVRGGHLSAPRGLGVVTSRTVTSASNSSLTREKSDPSRRLAPCAGWQA